MFKVSTTNLSEDLLTANADFGVRHLGLAPPGRLREILEAFRHVDAVQNHESSPHVAVSSDKGRFIVRTSAARLFLYDLSNPAGGATELSVDEIVAQLDTVQPDADSSADGIQSSKSRGRTKPLQQSIGLAMLVVGLLLNGYTLYSAFYIDDVNLSPPLTAIANKAEFDRARDSIVGSFATGSYSGDRGIVIQPDGTAQLLLFGEHGAIRSRIACTFVIGRRDNKLFVNLKPRGQIEVSSPDLLILFGDTYHRTH